VPWLCTPQCRLIEDGAPLYRDAHHLSVAGAMALKDELSRAFSMAAEPPHTGALPSVPALTEAMLKAEK